MKAVFVAVEGIRVVRRHIALEAPQSILVHVRLDLVHPDHVLQCPVRLILDQVHVLIKVLFFQFFCFYI